MCFLQVKIPHRCLGKNICKSEEFSLAKNNRFKVIAYLDIAINIAGRITINNVKAEHKAIIIMYVKGNFKEVLLDNRYFYPKRMIRISNIHPKSISDRKHST